jgi:hypothetical protein
MLNDLLYRFHSLSVILIVDGSNCPNCTTLQCLKCSLKDKIPVLCYLLSSFSCIFIVSKAEWITLGPFFQHLFIRCKTWDEVYSVIVYELFKDDRSITLVQSPPPQRVRTTSRQKGDIKQLPCRGLIDVGRPGFVHSWSSLRIEFNNRTT